MRSTSKRFASVAGTTVLAAVLAACGSSPTQQTSGSFPTTPYPTASNYPATPMPGQTYPSAGGTVTAPASVELGRVTDIQSVAMGQSGAAADPNAGRNRAIAGGIIGAVVGNVIGKNVNNGDNRTGTTVLGGAAGAAIGSGIGRNQSANTASSGAGAQAFRVMVQTDTGVMRTYEVGALGDLRVGDRVRVENGVIYRS